MEPSLDLTRMQGTIVLTVSIVWCSIVLVILRLFTWNEKKNMAQNKDDHHH